jgi:hypothetical protein
MCRFYNRRVIVLFTGMFRSGSTWAYNVARVMLRARAVGVRRVSRRRGARAPVT